MKQTSITSSYSQSTITSKAFKQFQDQLICPISFVLMQDPHDLPCGHAFSKDQIIQALKSKHKCPLCKKHYQVTDLKQNRLLKNIIQIQKQQTKRKQQQKSKKNQKRIQQFNKREQQQRLIEEERLRIYKLEQKIKNQKIQIQKQKQDLKLSYPRCFNCENIVHSLNMNIIDQVILCKICINLIKKSEMDILKTEDLSIKKQIKQAKQTKQIRKSNNQLINKQKNNIKCLRNNSCESMKDIQNKNKVISFKQFLQKQEKKHFNRKQLQYSLQKQFNSNSPLLYIPLKQETCHSCGVHYCNQSKIDRYQPYLNRQINKNQSYTHYKLCRICKIRNQEKDSCRNKLSTPVPLLDLWHKPPKQIFNKHYQQKSFNQIQKKYHQIEKYQSNQLFQKLIKQKTSHQDHRIIENSKYL